MRSRLVLLVMVLLAACSSTPESATVAPPTTAPNPPTDSNQGNEQPVGEQTAELTEAAAVLDITMPPPGTLVAAVTQDLNPDIQFDSILFEQSGGLSGAKLVVEVYSDGRVIRDGTASTITPQQVAELNAMLNAVNFFGLQGQFVMPGTDEDAYYFKMTVESQGGSRTINAQDGYTPDDLMAIFNYVSALGTGAPPA